MNDTIIISDPRISLRFATADDAGLIVDFIVRRRAGGIRPLLPQLLDPSRPARHLPRGPLRHSKASRARHRKDPSLISRQARGRARMRAARVVGAGLERTSDSLLRAARRAGDGRVDGLSRHGRHARPACKREGINPSPTRKSSLSLFRGGVYLRPCPTSPA